MTETTIRRHPGRAAAWGFLLGLGVFVYLTFVWPVIALDSWTSVTVKAVVVVLVVMAVSVLWGLFGPARKPKGPAPVADAPPPPPDEEAPPSPPDMGAPPPPPETDAGSPAPDLGEPPEGDEPIPD